MMNLYVGIVRPIHVVQVDMEPARQTIMKTLPGCCAHIHAVQVDMGPARQT